MNTRPEPGPQSAPEPARRGRKLSFAAEELRLISALVVLMAVGLFLALPFVLSIGSVVFLPLVTAIILTIILSPLADRLSQAGLPNVLSSFLALVAFLGIVILALTAVFRPAVGLFDQVPAMLNRIGEHFSRLQASFAWVSELNSQLLELTGREQQRDDERRAGTGSVFARHAAAHRVDELASDGQAEPGAARRLLDAEAARERAHAFGELKQHLFYDSVDPPASAACARARIHS